MQIVMEMYRRFHNIEITTIFLDIGEMETEKNSSKAKENYSGDGERSALPLLDDELAALDHADCILFDGDINKDSIKLRINNFSER